MKKTMEENTAVSQEEKKVEMVEELGGGSFEFGKDAMLVAGSVLLASLIIAGSIVATSQKFMAKAPTTKDAVQNAPSAPEKEDTNAITSLDDDAVLGDRKKAKVAIVEFSDYECPFCKKFHQDTFDKLVKEYVDTGKAVIAFRDFPLSFHDPIATTEAAVAECVRKEKGDKAYFSFGKAVYEGTQANGKGLGDGKLDELIRKAGTNPASINACAGSDAVKQEIAKDIADGGKVGISGTPSFIVGTLDENGNVTGERIVGALPFDNFKITVEKYLK
jgi:protein-disulfide isomerase